MAMDEKQNSLLTQKYLALLSIIGNIEDRLKWSRLGYTAMNLTVFFLTIFFVANVFERLALRPLQGIDVLFVLFCHVVGILINAHWATSAMRLQLKLKLRYFQARYLERKLDQAGEYFLTDESVFFNPANGRLESPDGKETVIYPKEGAFRMDGFVGAAKPRMFSLLMPVVFFLIFFSSFVTILLAFFN